MSEYCKIITDNMKKYSKSLTFFLMFLKQWADIFSYYNLTIEWSLPAVEDVDSIDVSQKYIKTEKYAITIINAGRQTSVTIKKPTGNVDRLKQKNTLAPNLIHSLDAYHVLLFVKLYTNNFTNNKDVSVIHDCFGVSVDNIDNAQRGLYDTYIHMYEKTTILNELYIKFIDSLKKNGVVVHYDEETRRHYIIVEKKSILKKYFKDFKSDVNFNGTGYCLYLPSLPDEYDSNWVDVFKKDFKYIHSFTP